MRLMLKSMFARCCRGHFALAGVVLAVALAGFGPLAQASDNDKAVARSHYETGTRLYEIREYDKALVEYKSAYLAQPDPAFLFNIGQCYRKLGQNQEALNFFQEYLKKASVDASSRSQVEARIRDIEAEIKLKAETAQPAPAPLVPAPALNPPPAPAAAPAPVATPAPAPAPTPIPAPAPAPIYQPQPQFAPGPQYAPPGQQLPLYSPMPLPAATFAPQAGSVQQTAPTNAGETGSGHGLHIAGIVICGTVGLASIGAGIYFYTRARAFSDQVNNNPSSLSAADAEYDDKAGKQAETLQKVFYGVGAGALVAGTLLAIFGWSSPDTSHPAASVTPMIGSGMAGLSAHGTF